jgi:O-antigen ligase
MAIVPFAVSLSLTLALISESNRSTYFRVFAFSIFLSLFTFLAQWKTGSLVDEWRRSLYFGESQPNLGGEIIFAGLLAASISTNLRSLYFLSYVILAFISAYLLEARSAMLAIFTIGLVALYFAVLKRIQPILRIFVLCAAVAVFAAVIGLDSSGGVGGAVNRIMLLDDPYRGLGTGFVGREERWDYALETFLQHPVFGVGFGYFNLRNDPTPHNLWLYMLSEMGLLSIVSIYALARAAYTLFKRNRIVLIFCSSALILTIFNDRFINMNAYPFVLYVILFLEVAWGHAYLQKNKRPHPASLD